MPQDANNPKTISIDPYQTTVPLVPLTLPEGDTVPKNSQSPPAFKGHAAGIATIGDSMLRGFLAGHAQKEQRKYAQASAAINAGQAAEQSAYQTYQDAIVAGKSPDEQKALYENYQGIYQKNTATMQQFAVPEKKGKKDGGNSYLLSSGDSKPKRVKDKDAPESQGFGGKIKDFFEANPHLVPQIAILTRSAGMKQPGLSPEGQAQQLKLKAAQAQSTEADMQLADEKRKQDAQKVYDQFSGLNEQEVAALPPEQQHQFKAAKAVLFPPKQAAEKSKIWTNKAGDFISLPENETPPPGSGYSPYEKTPTTGQKLFVDDKGGFHYAIPGSEEKGWTPFVASAMGKPGSPQYALQKFLESKGKTVQNATNEDIEEFNQQTAKDKQPSGTVTAGTTDEHGNHVSTTKKLYGGIGAPPKGNAAAGKTAKPAGGPLTPPPGKKTLTDANREERRTQDQQKGTATAYKEYSDKLAANGAKYGSDPASLQAANKLAQDTYHAKMWQNEKNFHRGEKMHLAKSGNVTVGSFDGKTWFNVETGAPVQ